MGVVDLAVVKEGVWWMVGEVKGVTPKAMYSCLQPYRHMPTYKMDTGPMVRKIAIQLFIAHPIRYSPSVEPIKKMKQ